MPTEAKRETVAQLREELARSSTYIVSEYRGLTVSELAEIRRALRKQNVSYRVVKNRLMRIAAAETKAEALSSLLTGPSRLDRRIECQQVSLRGNIFNHLHKFADSDGALFQGGHLFADPVHAHADVLHSFSPVPGSTTGGIDDLDCIVSLSSRTLR